MATSYNKPNKTQFKEIKRRFLNGTGIKVRRTDRWYNWLKVRVAKRLLKNLGITDVNNFLKRRFIAVSIGKTRFLLCPYKFGKNPISDICTLAHEHDHFLLAKKIGWAKFATRYLIPKNRVYIEASASASEYDVRELFGGGYKNHPSYIMTDEAAKNIYFLDKKHAALARKEYKKIISRDMVYKTKSSRRMCRIVDDVMSR